MELLGGKLIVVGTGPELVGVAGVLVGSTDGTVVGRLLGRTEDMSERSDEKGSSLLAVTVGSNALVTGPMTDVGSSPSLD